MGRKPFFTDSQKAEVKDLYASGLTCSEIAKRYGCSHAVVLNSLRKWGVEFRRRNKTAQPVDVIEAIELYSSGLTLMEIGERMGCSWMTIQRRLSEAGVSIRRNGPRNAGRISKYTSDAKRKAKRDYAKKRREAIAQRPHDGGLNGIGWRDIAVRDHMRCQICGCVVDENDKWKNEHGRWCFGRLYPTLDHIVALSNGGTDTYDNVQLACKRCNSKKQDKGQMRLAI